MNVTLVFKEGVTKKETTSPPLTRADI